MSKYKKTNDKKREQLGMPLGTAAARLRKTLLFKLIKETNKNICFQCGKPINEEKDLSIEHKVPWLDSEDPVGLFFDLENVAFSHLACNISAARRDIDSLRNTQREKVIKGQHTNSSLSMKEVLEIKENTSNLDVTRLAQKYGVSKHTIYRILKGRTYNYN